MREVVAVIALVLGDARERAPNGCPSQLDPALLHCTGVRAPTGRSAPTYPALLHARTRPRARLPSQRSPTRVRLTSNDPVRPEFGVRDEVVGGPSRGTRSAAIEAHADEAHHRREHVVMRIVMQDAEAALGRSRGDQIVRSWKSPTPAYISRGAERSGTHRRPDRGLRERAERAVQRLEAILVARAGQDLERRDRAGRSARREATSAAAPNRSPACRRRSRAGSSARRPSSALGLQSLGSAQRKVTPSPGPAPTCRPRWPGRLSYRGSITSVASQKRSISFDESVLAEAERQAAALGGNLSAFVNAAVVRELRVARGQALLAEDDEQFGPVPADVRAEVAATWPD